ncbi:hypothetical protein D3C81_1747900 [compost metagenome]
MRLVHHEAGRVAGVALPSRQEQGDGDGRHGARVIGNDVERQLAEKVVQADAIADIAAVGLDQNMRSGELVFRDVGHGVEDAPHHVTVDVAREGKVTVLIGVVLCLALCRVHGRHPQESQDFIIAHSRAAGRPFATDQHRSQPRKPGLLLQFGNVFTD